MIGEFANDIREKIRYKMAIIFFSIGVIAVIICFILFLNNNSKEKYIDTDYVMYIKNNECYFNDLNKDSNICKLTQVLGNADVINTDYLEYKVGCFIWSNYLYMSEDCTVFFYPDSINLLNYFMCSYIFNYKRYL